MTAWRRQVHALLLPGNSRQWGGPLPPPALPTTTTPTHRHAVERLQHRGRLHLLPESDKPAAPAQEIGHGWEWKTGAGDGWVGGWLSVAVKQVKHERGLEAEGQDVRQAESNEQESRDAWWCRRRWVPGHRGGARTRRSQACRRAGQRRLACWCRLVGAGCGRTSHRRAARTGGAAQPRRLPACRKAGFGRWLINRS